MFCGGWPLGSAAFCEVDARVAAHYLEDVGVLVVENRPLAPCVVDRDLLIKVPKDDKATAQLNEARQVAQLRGWDHTDLVHHKPGLMSRQLALVRLQVVVDGVAVKDARGRVGESYAVNPLSLSLELLRDPCARPRFASAWRACNENAAPLQDQLRHGLWV